MKKFKTTVIDALNVILPRWLKNSLFHVSFHLAGAEFDRFAYHYGFAPNMELGLAAFAKRGLVPKTVIDVGAFEGDWSKMARNIWPDSHLLMFEANIQKQDRLSIVADSIGATLYCEILGAEDTQ